MIQAVGIGTLTTPGSSGVAKSRDQQGTSKAAPRGDALEISPASKQASQVASLIEAAAAESEVRTERVEAAKEQLRQGSHKIQEVVTHVAAVLTKYI